VREPDAAPTAPAEPKARPLVLLALVVVVTVAVLLSGFAVVDWVSRNRELNVLLDRIERAERSQLLPRDSLGPLLSDCYFSPAECDTATIARIAARSLPELEATGEEVATTRLTRHHGAIRNLRDRYVDHNLAWQDWLAVLAMGGSGEVEPPGQINLTFREAGRAARAAVPPFALSGARGRVDELFR